VQQTPPDSFIVSVIKEPEPELTVADVIVGSLGVTGALVLLALVLGAVTGTVLVLWRRWRPREWRPMPPVSPSWMDERPPSSRVR
jgi:hypothetical protein